MGTDTWTSRNTLILAFFITIIGSSYILHERMHWVFVVPFGGSFYDWHWYTTASHIRVPPPEPCNTISYYAGGLAACLFLSSLLFLWVIPRLRHTVDHSWFYSGAILAFFAAFEFADGILEGICQGAPGSLYSNKPLAYLILLPVGVAGLGLYWKKHPKGLCAQKKATERT